MAETEKGGSVSIGIGVDNSELRKGLQEFRTATAEIKQLVIEQTKATTSGKNAEEKALKDAAKARADEIAMVDKATAAAKVSADKLKDYTDEHNKLVAQKNKVILDNQKIVEAANGKITQATQAAANRIIKANGQIAAAEAELAAKKVRDAAVFANIEVEKAKAAEWLKTRLAAIEAQRVARMETLYEREYQAFLRLEARKEREAERAANRQARLAEESARGPLGSNGRGPKISRAGMQVQNAAYQITDVLAMGANDGNWGRAIGIQAPQLLAGFGPVGAALGVVAAVLLPLTTRLFGAGEAASAAKEATDAFNDSLSNLDKSTAAAKTPLAELRKQFGSVAEEVRKARQAQEEIDLAKAQKAFSSTISLGADEQDENLGGVRKMLEAAQRVQEARVRLAQQAAELQKQFENGVIPSRIGKDSDPAWILKAQTAELERMAKTMHMNAQEFVAFFDKLESLTTLANKGDKASVEQALSIANELKGTLVQTFGTAQAIPPELAGMYGYLVDAANASGDLLGKINATADAADQITFQRAINEADFLVSRLAAAQSAIIGIMQTQAQALRAANLRIKYAGDPVGLAGAQARDSYDDATAGLRGKGGKDDLAYSAEDAVAAARTAAEAEKEATRLEEEARKAAREAAGGGGSKKPKLSDAEKAENKAELGQLKEDLRDAEAIYNSTRDQREKLEEERARITALGNSGMLGLTEEQRDRLAGMTDAARAATLADPDVMARSKAVMDKALEDLGDEYSHLNDLQDEVKDGAQGVFSAIITGSGSATEALSNMASRLANMFADQAFDTGWDLLKGAFSGGTSAASSGVGFWSSLASAASSAFSGFFATGSDRVAPGFAIAGEYGPELVKFGSDGGSVANARQTQAILEGAGSGAMHLALDLTLSDDLNARIDSRSQEIALNTTRKGLKEYSNTVAPARQAQIAANPRRKS